MAEDVLSLMLTHFEDWHQEIPQPSAINNLATENGAFATYISCDTTVYRRLMNNTAVKKTFSIPSWLNHSAVAAGLNFSQVLQDASKQQLNIIQEKCLRHINSPSPSIMRGIRALHFSLF